MQELSSLRLHHVGFAVRSLSDSRLAFEAMGAQFFHESSDVDRNLDFQFATLGKGIIELVAPHDPSRYCTVTNMIEKHPYTLYHICLEAHDLEAELQKLKSAGFKQLGKTAASEAYGYEVEGAFLFSKGTGVVELIQECKNVE